MVPEWSRTIGALKPRSTCGTRHPTLHGGPDPALRGARKYRSPLDSPGLRSGGREIRMASTTTVHPDRDRTHLKTISGRRRRPFTGATCARNGRPPLWSSWRNLSSSPRTGFDCRAWPRASMGRGSGGGKLRSGPVSRSCRGQQSQRVPNGRGPVPRACRSPRWLPAGACRSIGQRALRRASR